MKKNKLKQTRTSYDHHPVPRRPLPDLYNCRMNECAHASCRVHQETSFGSVRWVEKPVLDDSLNEKNMLLRWKSISVPLVLPVAAANTSGARRPRCHSLDRLEMELDQGGICKNCREKVDEKEEHSRTPWGRRVFSPPGAHDLLFGPAAVSPLRAADQWTVIREQRPRATNPLQS